MNSNLLKLLELVEKDKIIFQLLRQCPYEILRNFQVKEYKDSQFVLNQGEIYDTFYIVVSGYMDIYVESEHGKKYLLCTYTKGDYIGELEIFQQAGYISRVEARGDVTVLELDRSYFVQWIRMDNNFNEYMIRTLCGNTYRMCAEMGHNTLYTLKQRICQYLISNMGADGRQRFVVSSEILSQKMAVTQRSINRVLKQLKELGIIEMNRGNIMIRDYKGLIREQDQK